MSSLSVEESILIGFKSLYDTEFDSQYLELKRLAADFDCFTLQRGDRLWSYESHRDRLFFVVKGSLGEYLLESRQASLIRLYKSHQFAFSEDSLIYGNTSNTECVSLTESTLASVPKEVIMSGTMQQQVGAKLLGILINLSMTEYRNTTYEMLQVSGRKRIQAALSQSPNLLNIIPRDELADYLGISRASLFRALKSLDDE